MDFLSLSMLWLLLAVSPAIPAKPSTETAPERIRVVANKNYPPYLFLDEHGVAHRHIVDRWKLVERYTGIKIDVIPASWEAEDALRGGKADLIDLIYRTPERDADYEFSEAVRHGGDQRVR